LPSVYRDRLKASLDDGSLAESFHYLDPSYEKNTVAKEFAMLRAEKLVRNWDSYFWE